MPLATRIKLSSAVKPTFPNLCIVCHTPPDSTITVLQNSSNWLWAILFPILAPIFALTGWSRVQVPICRKCKLMFRAQAWSRRLLILALLVLAIWLTPEFAMIDSRFLKRLAGLAFCAVMILPYLILEIFFPRYFTTQASRDAVDYEFESSDYADAFYALNADHVLEIS